MEEKVEDILRNTIEIQSKSGLFEFTNLQIRDREDVSEQLNPTEFKEQRNSFSFGASL